MFQSYFFLRSLPFKLKLLRHLKKSVMPDWLRVNLEGADPSLSFINLTHDPMGDSISISGRNVTMGIGWWHYRPTDMQRIVYHEGGTYGQTAFLGFDSDFKIGVVILCNFFSSHPDMQSGKGINNPNPKNGGISKVTDLGFQILKREWAGKTP